MTFVKLAVAGLLNILDAGEKTAAIEVCSEVSESFLRRTGGSGAAHRIKLFARVGAGHAQCHSIGAVNPASPTSVCTSDDILRCHLVPDPIADGSNAAPMARPQSNCRRRPNKHRSGGKTC